MAAECFVIAKADWDQLMQLFAGMFLLLACCTVFSPFDRHSWEYRVRRYLRRRRIARIREAAHGR